VTEKVVGIVVTEVQVRAAGAVSIEQFALPLVCGGPGGTWFGSGLKSTVVTKSNVWVCWIRHRWAFRML
jgi:hypothetical protein